MMSDASKGETARILLIGSREQSDKLAGRILALGVEPVPARDFDEAIDLVTSHRAGLEAALVPTRVDTEQLAAGVRGLVRTRPTRQLISYGLRPTSHERNALREAGVRLALWDPYDDGTLRFQLNRALAREGGPQPRREPRVPTYLLARIEGGGRTKDAILYSLSRSGTFLETPRASMPGARIRVEIRLPSGPFSCNARVVFANVPGNLQRPNLPLGMGVAFEDVSAANTRALEVYIDERLEDLTV